MTAKAAPSEERLCCLHTLVISDISVGVGLSLLKLNDCGCTEMTSLSLHFLNNLKLRHNYCLICHLRPTHSYYKY